MSEPGPLGGNPFEGMPFFGDLARMLGQQGQVSWDAARQIALSVATEGKAEPNVDPLERMRLEELGRVAEVNVAATTGLSTSTTGAVVTVRPVTRAQWVQRTLDDYRPLLERLAESLRSVGETEGLDDLGDLGAGFEGGDEADAAMGWLGGVLRMLQPMMLAMTAGSMVGHLAQRNLAQHDLPVPRPPSDELLLIVPNLDAFGSEWSLSPDDLRLWICLHEITHHAVLGVRHVRAALDDLVTRYVSAFRADPGALEQHIGDLSFDPGDPDSLVQIQQALGDPEVLLGAIQSAEQRALKPRIDALVTVIVGYVDHVMDRIGERLIPSYAMVTEALRRRRVEASDADRFVERLFGLELGQATYDRGAAFADGVAARAGTEALARLWEDERFLPTPPEVDAPGLWLARIEID